VIVQPIETNL